MATCCHFRQVPAVHGPDECAGVRAADRPMKASGSSAPTQVPSCPGQVIEGTGLLEVVGADSDVRKSCHIGSLEDVKLPAGLAVWMPLAAVGTYQLKCASTFSRCC
jgi:hypothetical protein